jgi:hypothetical protein
MYGHYALVEELPSASAPNGFIAIPAFSFLGLAVFAMIILWPL